jgi:hypothetical protein
VVVPLAALVAGVVLVAQVGQGFGGPSPSAIAAQVVGLGRSSPSDVASGCTRRCTPEQIYALARRAGCAPDGAATMTAISLAESEGDPRAHNPVGEDSRGLWQINAAAHPEFARVDLYDPAQNARAAYAVSGGCADISPWTTTHLDRSAPYLVHREQAQAAAVAYGDGAGRGMWAGSAGYGVRTPAGAR